MGLNFIYLFLLIRGDFKELTAKVKTSLVMNSFDLDCNFFFFFFFRREGEGVREVERECMTGEMRETLLRTVTLHKTHIVLFWVMYALGN